MMFSIKLVVLLISSFVLGSDGAFNVSSLINLSMRQLLASTRTLDLSDLVRLKESSPRDQLLADAIFQGRQWDDVFAIKGYRLVRGNQFDVMLSALKHFGHLIHEISIDLRLLPPSKCAQLNHQLNEYCAESLNTIEYLNSENDFFTELIGPFANVHTIKFECGFSNMNSTRLDRIFPALDQLTVIEMHSPNVEFVELHYPQLKHFSIELWMTHHREYLPILEQLLTLNPQLESLSLIRGDWNFLTVFSKTLPLLDRLEISHFFDMATVCDDIQFKQLKVLRFDRTSEIRSDIERIPMIFGQLEEIEFYEPINKWIDIVCANKQLTIITTGILLDSHMEQMADNLHELREIHIQNIDSVHSFVEFVQKFKHLQKFAIREISSSIRDDLVRQLPNWQTYNGFMFIKKTNDQ